MQFLFAAPLALPFGDAPYTGIVVRHLAMDLDAGTVTATCAPIEDPLPSKVRVVVINLTPTQIANYTAALKNAIATALGVALQ